MAITDYNSLQSAVNSYVIYDDISSEFGTLLGLAEAVMNREVRIRQMQASRDYSSQSTQTLTLPDDFIEAITFYQDGENGGTLEYLPPKLFWGSRDGRTGTGQPAFYTTEDATLSLAPSPDGARDYVLKYYAKVDGLSSSNTTNDLLTTAPDVYLWQVLYQAALLSDDEPSQQKYERNYLAAKQSLHDADKRGRLRPGPRMRSRTTRDGYRRLA